MAAQKVFIWRRQLASAAASQSMATHTARQRHKHLKNRNRLERLNQEIRRRTNVGPIFPSHNSARRGMLKFVPSVTASQHARAGPHFHQAKDDFIFPNFIDA